MSDRLAMVERAMSIVFMFTNDHNAASQDQKTVQLIGVRLFNAAASGIKLALSGYYQPAFHQVRDVLEIGFLLDFFRRWPEQIQRWETSDRVVRRQHFDPVVIRKALNKDDSDESRRHETEYRKLSERASHLTPQGFVMTVRGAFAEFGPFVDAPRLLAWLHEAILRFGPSRCRGRAPAPRAGPSFFWIWSTAPTFSWLPI